MTEKKCITDIEGLSRVFIETMKDISTNNESLNEASLKKILGERDDVKNLFHSVN